MYNNTLYVGMDVHKETFSLCCYDMQQDRIFHAQKMEADYNQVLNYLNAVQKAIGDDVQFVCGYEAGCLGFTLYHQLTRYGVNCVILAPTTMSKPAGKKKVKTDKRDAENIARCLAYHTYSPVHIPSDQDEQVKEYIRMRDDHKLALKKVKQQILAFCLRHGYHPQQNTHGPAGGRQNGCREKRKLPEQRGQDGERQRQPQCRASSGQGLPDGKGGGEHPAGSQQAAGGGEQRLTQNGRQGRQQSGLCRAVQRGEVRHEPFHGPDKGRQFAEGHRGDGNNGCQQGAQSEWKPPGGTAAVLISPAGCPEQQCHQCHRYGGTRQIHAYVPQLATAAGDEGLVVLVQPRQHGTEDGGKGYLMPLALNQGQKGKPQQQNEDKI